MNATTRFYLIEAQLRLDYTDFQRARDRQESRSGLITDGGTQSIQ